MQNLKCVFLSITNSLTLKKTGKGERKENTLGTGDMVQWLSACYSCRRPEFGPQYLHR